jgi:hypothetical protein
MRRFVLPNTCAFTHDRQRIVLRLNCALTQSIRIRAEHPERRSFRPESRKKSPSSRTFKHPSCHDLAIATGVCRNRSFAAKDQLRSLSREGQQHPYDQGVFNCLRTSEREKDSLQTLSARPPTNPPLRRFLRQTRNHCSQRITPLLPLHSPRSDERSNRKCSTFGEIHSILNE